MAPRPLAQIAQRAREHLRLGVSYKPTAEISLGTGVVSVSFGADRGPAVGPDAVVEALDRADHANVLAGEVSQAVRDGSLTTAVDRLNVLAGQFPGSDRREATYLSERVRLYSGQLSAVPSAPDQVVEAHLRAEILGLAETYRARAVAEAHALAAQSTTPLSTPTMPTASESALSSRSEAGPEGVEASPPALRADDLEWAVRGRQILSAANLRVMGGTVVGVVGNNGAGKTTLLRLLAQRLAPTSGRVSYPALAARGYDHARCLDSIAFVSQPPTPYPGTLEEHLRLFAALRGVRGDHLDNVVASLIARFRLGSVRDRTWRELSDGFRARVALARCLSTQPRIIILDEPLAALDPDARRRYLTDLVDEARSFAEPAWS